MQYIIRMGVPEMSGFWNDLLSRRKLGTLSNKELELFNRIAKTLQHLSVNPRHTGLRTHEIEPLSRKYGFKIWQSYLDQGKTARRIFWAYGPNRKEILYLESSLIQKTASVVLMTESNCQSYQMTKNQYS